MLKVFGKFLLFTVIVAGGLFSAINTFTLFGSIFGGDLFGLLTSLAGLALFDVGALAWLLFYSHSAKGFAQRTVAGLAAGLCLLLTFSAAAAEVLLTQSLITAPDWAPLAAIVSILVGLFVNLAAAALIHVFDPATLKEMADQSARDARAEQIRAHKERIEKEAFRMSEDMITQSAGWVATQLGEGMRADTIRELLGHRPGGQQAPAVTVIEGQNAPASAPIVAPAPATPTASAPAQDDEPIAAPAGLFTTTTEAPAPKARRGKAQTG